MQTLRDFSLRFLSFQKAFLSRFQAHRFDWPAVQKRLLKHTFVGIFLVGVSLGAGAKIMARETFALGAEDYRLPSTERLYDLNATQDRALAEGGSLTLPSKKVGYPACSLDQ